MNKVFKHLNQVDYTFFSFTTPLSHKFDSTTSRCPRVRTCCFHAVYIPIRKLFSIPVTIGRTLLNNLLPSIMLTEGWQLARKNFSFSRENIVKYVLLAGMVGCMASKLWLNDWVNDTNSNMYEIREQASNTSIPKADFDAQFYSSISAYVLSFGVYTLIETLNVTCESLLNTAITFKNQYEFVQEWLSNFSIYGINANDVSLSGDKDKTNLSPIELFKDIEKKNGLITLWYTRIMTTMNCYTAIISLWTKSPWMTIPLYFYSYSISLPRFLVLSVIYSAIFNLLLWIIEQPIRYFSKNILQFQNRLTNLITNINANAELISFLHGETFEEKRLLDLLRLKYKQTIWHDLTNSIRNYVNSCLGSFQSLLPWIALIDAIRDGSIESKDVLTLTTDYYYLNSFITWSKSAFEELKTIEESVDRINLFKKRIEDWKVKREAIEKKIVDSDDISFNGSVYADKQQQILLAQGSFTLPKGSRVHFDARSGFGKTTLFRIFAGISNASSEKTICSLPKKATIFLPSQPYILGGEESLFQTICYPAKFQGESNSEQKQKIALVQEIFKRLNLPPQIYDNLTKLPLSDNKDINQLQVANWMTSLSDGERKRIAFCNAIFKLMTQEIKFLIMDEPFKGVDFETQKVMVALILEAIGPNSPSHGCTILFSNHEQNHGLNTCRLKVDSTTKQYILENL